MAGHELVLLDGASQLCRCGARAGGRTRAVSGGTTEKRKQRLRTASAEPDSTAKGAEIAFGVRSALFERGSLSKPRLFYYSGHADTGALYPNGKPLPLAALRERLDDPRATVRVGIIDACRGGGWTRAKGLTSEPPFEVGLPLALSSEGSVLLASSSGVDMFVVTSKGLVSWSWLGFELAAGHAKAGNGLRHALASIRQRLRRRGAHALWGAPLASWLVQFPPLVGGGHFRARPRPTSSLECATTKRRTRRGRCS